jgi:hypothetical protein
MRKKKNSFWTTMCNYDYYKNKEKKKLSNYYIGIVGEAVAPSYGGF